MSLEPSHSPSSGRKSPLGLVREEVSSKYGAFFQEYTVLSEYCQLLQQPVPGVYVLTSNVSPLSFYKDGVFKFTLSIPNNYPEGGCPRIDLQSGVYHPQVNYDTGELETKRHFQRWRRDVNCLRDLLMYARNMFQSIDSDYPINEEAALLYANDKGEFKERVAKSIKECMQIIMETTDQGDPHDIKIGEWHHEVMKAAREQIFEPEISEVDSSSGLPNGLSWVKPNTYTPFSTN